jgi:Fe-S-cluster containining protein
MTRDPKHALPVVFDCLECGACCFQRPGTILVTSEDIDRWTTEGRTDILSQLEPGHFGEMAFRMSERGCCVFHGTESHPHACAIYEDRATVCREFAAGCAQCREFRRDQGLG